MNTVFIQANNKQLLGAKLAKHAIESKLKDKNSVKIEILNVDENTLFKSFIGKTYLRNGKEITYNPNDLQSFTLSRFMPPELMGYQGKAVVIDPDIFTLIDINELFTMDMGGKAILACSKKGAWDTSMMVLDCAKLRHWKIADMLQSLEKKDLQYGDIMSMTRETSVQEVPRIYNSLDILNPNTKLVHMTDRLTQPWKTGLKIDFTRNDPGKYLGIIPKIWILKLRGKWPSYYQKHPNQKMEVLFFSICKKALGEGIITKSEMEKNITNDFIRHDIFQYIA
jgi:hypothetical protein